MFPCQSGRASGQLCADLVCGSSTPPVSKHNQPQHIYLTTIIPVLSRAGPPITPFAYLQSLSEHSKHKSSVTK
ncbi:hypothetical protein AG1IA_05528 [Rhizoctonia solani AG-1 IA]|uniref:Uncharacterized protein n=1 Tax=Thanatephorus cucumeris (strain AG1-IA) TaxID=983506 RepID=L8WUK6_THACA|nr:hypothetical protein AG1IA_05528 [Rhizoctonia solani AG-1 IA]